MKQITESYVSFETAKFLKEKGFDIPTKDFYDTTGENLKDSKTIYGGIPNFGKVNWNADPFICEEFPKLITFSKPSQSLALKWLREVHNAIISLQPNTFYCNGKCSSWNFSIWCMDNLEIDGSEYNKNAYDSYEQAVEAAIKYTLENLI